MNWLNKLKIALLNEDDQAAFLLVDNLPQELENESLEIKLHALELIKQTKTLLDLNNLKLESIWNKSKQQNNFLKMLIK